ncbi:MAG: aminopeptidase P family N-terminal domain-containing protein [Acidimicrobiia bacterium]|nr:aminopeptidase P family N-terminal domain-containing protein [Acidimicrobiia bacterium]
MDVRSRIERLRARFDEAGIDALLVTHLVNVRYLTGFTGSAARLVVRPDELLFVTDGRYGDQAARQLGDAGVDATIEVAGADQKRIVAERGPGGVPPGAGGRARELGAAAHVRRGVVPGERAGAHRGPGRGAAAGQGPG